MRTTTERAPHRGAADARRVRARDAARRAGHLPEGPRADPDPRRHLPRRARPRVGRRVGRAHPRRCCARSARPATSPATSSATTSPPRARSNVEGFLGPDLPLDIEVRDVYDGIDVDDLDRILLDLPEPWRVVKHAEAALHPGGILLAYLPTIGQVVALARGARRLGVRHGRDARGAAAHLARRRPVGATRPPHGRAHRLPHPRAAARAGGVNFLDLVVLGVAAGAGWVGYRLGFVRRVTSWAGLAIGIVVARRCSSPDVTDVLRGSPPRTRLLASLAFVIAGRRPSRRRSAPPSAARSHARLASPRGRRAPPGRPRRRRGGRRRRRARDHVAAHPGAGELAGLDGPRGARQRGRARHRPARARPAVGVGDPRPPGRRPAVPRGVRHAHVTRRRVAARRRHPRRRRRPRHRVDRAGRGPGVRPHPGGHRVRRRRRTSSSPTRTSSRGEPHPRRHDRRPPARRRRRRVRPEPRPRGAARARARPARARRGRRPRRRPGRGCSVIPAVVRCGQAPVRIAEQIVARRHRHLPHARPPSAACSCSPRSPRPATPAARSSTPRAGSSA